MTVCIGCGCDEYHACYDEKTERPCYWLITADNVGVCSACPDLANGFLKGDREMRVPVEPSRLVDNGEEVLDDDAADRLDA